MRIDCHVHLVGQSRIAGGYVSRRMSRSISFAFLLRKMGLHKLPDAEARDRAYVARLVGLLRESELDGCVLLAFDQVHGKDGAPRPELTDLYVPNDRVRDVAREHPGELLYGASVHPLRADALDELARVKEEGAVLNKLLPNSQGFDPADPALAAYWRRAADLGLATLIHCGFEHTVPAKDQRLGDPRRLAPVLDSGAVIIVAHGGTSGRFHARETFGDTLSLMARWPNLYGDTSAMANVWRSKYLFELLAPERLERKYGVVLEQAFERFVHGSDYPIPITPWAFFWRTRRADRVAARRCDNPLQADIILKRAAGVPDACLDRTAKVLGLTAGHAQGGNEKGASGEGSE